jgi:hypothetical protein
MEIKKMQISQIKKADHSRTDTGPEIRPKSAIKPKHLQISANIRPNTSI